MDDDNNENKSEIRNKVETNPKFKKTLVSRGIVVFVLNCFLKFSYFGFVSYFEFRISDFRFLPQAVVSQQ